MRCSYYKHSHVTQIYMRPYRAKSMVDIRHGSFNWPKHNMSLYDRPCLGQKQGTMGSQARPIYKLLPEVELLFSCRHKSQPSLAVSHMSFKPWVTSSNPTSPILDSCCTNSST
jgi:hypothetical protein